MEQYRLRYAPSRNCRSCDFLDAVLEQALPKVDEGSEKIFEELESRQETLFFSRKGLEPTLRNITNITKLVTCECNACKDHRPVGLDILALVTRTFDEAWLILGILIYLGKLHFLHSWLNSEREISNLNLDAAMTHLATSDAASSLFSSITEKRMFEGAYKRAINMFDPVVFKIPTSGIYSRNSYTDLCRFPYLDEPQTFRSGSSGGSITKFMIPEEYLLDQVKTRVSEYSSCNRAVGMTNQYTFIRKVIKVGQGKFKDDIEVGMEFDMLRMVASLTKPVSDNIIALVALYTYRKAVHFIFPFVESDLHTVLRSGWHPTLLPHQAPGQSFPDHWLWKQMVRVSCALSAIHTDLQNPFPEDTGRVFAFHFDLKPANILVTATGVLKITDFGQSLIQIVDDGDDQQGYYKPGDLVYRAPESKPSRDSMKAVHQSLNPQNLPEVIDLLKYDVWSLACIMTEVLTSILDDSSDPLLNRAIIDLDERRKSEAPDIAFFGYYDLKECIKEELYRMKTNSRFDIPSQKYMSSLYDLLFSMFAYEKKDREFSQGVVRRLELIREQYDNDKQPEDPLIQLVRDDHDPNPDGCDEIGWIDTQPTSFLYLDGVTFEQIDKHGQRKIPEQSCRIQLFYRRARRSQPGLPGRTARLCIRRNFWTSQGNYKSPEYSFETESCSYIPIYLYRTDASTTSKQFPCALCNGDQLLFLYRFQCLEDAHKFQAAILRHTVVPTPNLNISRLIVKYNKAEESLDVPGQLAAQIWSEWQPPTISQTYRVVRAFSTTTIESASSSTSSSTARPLDAQKYSLIIFAERTTPFIYLPLNDGQKLIQRDTQRGYTNQVKIVPNRHLRQKDYKITRPHAHSPWRHVHNFAAPAIPLDPNLFEIPEEEMTDWMKEIKSMFITFGDIKGMESLRSATKGTGRSPSWDGP